MKVPEKVEMFNMQLFHRDAQLSKYGNCPSDNKYIIWVWIIDGMLVTDHTEGGEELPIRKFIEIVGLLLQNVPFIYILKHGLNL